MTVEGFGFEVTAKVTLLEVDKRRLVFEVQAHDGVELISKGLHERSSSARRSSTRRYAKKLRNAARSPDRCPLTCIILILDS
jgi:fluoroacetyl-CoA thioesterase